MSQDDIKKEIDKLVKKSEQNRHMHFSINKNANLWNKILHINALIGSAMIAILTFAEYNTFVPWFPELTNENYKLTIALFAGLIFIITVLEGYLRLEQIAATHDAIGKQLTTFIRQMSTQALTQDELMKATDKYISICESAPTIPDGVFIREKQRWMVKNDLSQKLEETPYMSVRLYRIKMKIKQLFSTNEPQNPKVKIKTGDRY